MAQERYGDAFQVAMKDLHKTDDLRVLDFNGERALRLFRLEEFGAPVMFERKNSRFWLIFVDLNQRACASHGTCINAKLDKVLDSPKRYFLSLIRHRVHQYSVVESPLGRRVYNSSATKPPGNYGADLRL